MSGSGTGGVFFNQYGTSSSSLPLNRNATISAPLPVTAAALPNNEHLVNEMKHEILDDKYNKSLLQQRALSQETRGGWFLYISAAILLATLTIVLLVGAFVYASQPLSPSTAASISRPYTQQNITIAKCDWGTYSDENGICAPNETILFDWYAIRKSRNSGVCTSPRLSEWICSRYQSETTNGAVFTDGNPYERYLNQYASHWAHRAINEDPLLSLAKKFACDDSRGAASAADFSKLHSIIRSRALDNTTSVSKWMGYAVTFGVAPIVMGTAPDPRIHRNKTALLVLQPSNGTAKRDITELHATGALELQIMSFSRAKRLLQEKLVIESWEDFWSGIQSALSLIGVAEGIPPEIPLDTEIWIRDIESMRASTTTTREQLLVLASPAREPVQVTSCTQSLLGTPDEYFTTYRNKDTSKRCVERVKIDFYRVFSHLLAKELETVGRVLDPRSSGHRQLYKLFAELVDSMKQIVQESKSISSESKLRLVEKVSSMKLEVSASPLRHPIAFRHNNSYQDLLLSIRAVSFAESLAWYLEEQNDQEAPVKVQNTLEPTLYYDRLRNAVVLHPFMLSELMYPFHPFDSASMLNVYTRLGWRIAREMYWAFDLQVGASHDSNGSVSPHWLYPVSSDLERVALIRQEKKADCLATRFAFCLTLRALTTHADRDPFAVAIVKNATNIEWLERAFWTVSMTYACAGNDSAVQDFDKCLQTFPPYRVTFDCSTTMTTGKRKLYQTLCGKESVSSAWCSCMPFD